MISEQEGPPTEADRERRDTDYVKRAQERYAEGYRHRAATFPPEIQVRVTRSGRPVMRQQPHASLADDAERLCPRGYPAHERERWTAGFLDADRLAVERGHGALEGRDPLKPVRRRSVALAEPLDAFGDEGRVSRAEAAAYWRRHHGQGTEYQYRDAGEQKK